MYFNQFKIETDKTQLENIEILETFVCKDIQPLVAFHFDFKGKPFFGSISENKFDILPVIEGRNSFVPVLKGEIIGDSKSVIVVKMRLHLLVIVFIVFITLLILLSLLKNIHNGGLYVLSFMYIFVFYMYWKESKKWRKRFESYFK